MSKQMFQALYNELMKANNKRKLKLAEKYGYVTVLEYKNYLRAQLGMEPVVEEVVEKPTIHIVYVQDSSGSMFNYGSRSKFDEAIEGINAEIADLKKNKTANYKVTVFEFSTELHNLIRNKPIENVDGINWIKLKRGTALNDSLMEIFSYLRNVNDKDIKVLIKVFTDGHELHSFKYDKRQVTKAIAELPENMTFTFVAAEADMYNIEQYSIEKSNVLYHDNTAEGVAASFQATFKSTVSYATNVAEGKDVSRGFYKEVVND